MTTQGAPLRNILPLLPLSPDYELPEGRDGSCLSRRLP